jgi:hypothetical protein
MSNAAWIDQLLLDPNSIPPRVKSAEEEAADAAWQARRDAEDRELANTVREASIAVRKANHAFDELCRSRCRMGRNEKTSLRLYAMTIFLQDLATTAEQDDL